MTFGPTARRWLVTYSLAGMGAIVGAVSGAVLTLLSYVLIGVPHIPRTEYFIYNATSFAILGSVIAPVGAWLCLRRVPLWRAVAEPALVGVLAVAATISVGVLPFFLFPAVAVLASAWRLNRAYNPVATSRTALSGQRQVRQRPSDSGTTL